MPGKKDSGKSMKTNRKHRQRKSAPLPKGLTTIAPGITDRFMARMSYGAFGTLTTAASNWNKYTWRGNSVFDPDVTGVGTTATLFAQLAGCYYRYRVISSKFVLDVANMNAAPLAVSLIASISSAPPALTENQIAARHEFRRMIAGSTGNATLHHEAEATTARIYGVQPAQVLGEDDYVGLNTGNPSNVWYWHLVADNKASAVAGALNFSVRIEYLVEWMSPLDLTY